MQEDVPQDENTDPAGADNPAEGTQAGGEGGPGPEAARITELAGQLESLRAERAAHLAAYCDLARSLPGLVPELVGGSSLEAVQGSLAAAREAYNRIAASLIPASLPEGGGEKSFGPLPGAGGGARSGFAPGEDQPARLASERGVNLIYQALAGGKNGNLAR